MVFIPRTNTSVTSTTLSHVSKERRPCRQHKETGEPAAPLRTLDGNVGRRFCQPREPQSSLPWTLFFLSLHSHLTTSVGHAPVWQLPGGEFTGKKYTKLWSDTGSTYYPPGNFLGLTTFRGQFFKQARTVVSKMVQKSGEGGEIWKHRAGRGSVQPPEPKNTFNWRLHKHTPPPTARSAAPRNRR